MFGYLVNCTSPGYAGTRYIGYTFDNVPARYHAFTKPELVGGTTLT